jgi:hypothetical protein
MDELWAVAKICRVADVTSIAGQPRAGVTAKQCSTRTALTRLAGLDRRETTAQIWELSQSQASIYLGLIAAHSQFLAIFKQYQVMASEPTLDFLNAVYVYNGGPMNPQEIKRIESLFKARKSLTKFVFANTNV